MSRPGPEDDSYVPRGPYIWGFPLGDLSFGAFSSTRMFDPRWHLRKERFSESLLIRAARNRRMSGTTAS